MVVFNLTSPRLVYMQVLFRSLLEIEVFVFFTCNKVWIFQTFSEVLHLRTRKQPCMIHHRHVCKGTQMLVLGKIFFYLRF